MSCRNVQWQHLILAAGLDHVSMLTLALKAPLLVLMATQHNMYGKRSILYYTHSLKPQPGPVDHSQTFLKSASIHLFICTINTQRGIKLVLFWHKFLVLHARTHINEPQICSVMFGNRRFSLIHLRRRQRTPSRWLVILKIIRSPASSSCILWFISVLSLPQPRSVFAVYLHTMLICWLCFGAANQYSSTTKKKLGGDYNLHDSTLSNKWFDKMIMIMVLKINLIITAFYSNVRCYQLRQH